MSAAAAGPRSEALATLSHEAAAAALRAAASTPFSAIEVVSRFG